MEYTVERYGGMWLAHRADHDCLDDVDGSKHAHADHPVAALRQLLRQEEEG